MKLTEKIELFLEDNLKLMRSLPDKCIDLAIIDAEYGINASKPSDKTNLSVKQKNGKMSVVKGTKHVHKDWDSSTPPIEFFTELMRVSKHQIIFGVNYYSDIKFGPGRIVWDKLNGESDQYGCEIAYCSLNNRTDVIYFLWRGMIQGYYCGRNVKKAFRQQGNKKLNEKIIHPTQKPVPVYKYILQTYAKPGWKIADFNFGSGSLGIAAHDLGFELIACEKDEDIFNKSVARFNKHLNKTQPKEFSICASNDYKLFGYE